MVVTCQPSTPDRIRTCDLSFRKAALYPTELPGQDSINIVEKIGLFRSKDQIFPRFRSAKYPIESDESKNS